MRQWREDTLRFISDYQRDNWCAPSIREMCAGLGMRSPGSMRGRLDTLRDEGLVEWIDHHPRTVRLTDEGRRRIEEPVL